MDLGRIGGQRHRPPLVILRHVQTPGFFQQQTKIGLQVGIVRQQFQRLAISRLGRRRLAKPLARQGQAVQGMDRGRVGGKQGLPAIGSCSVISQALRASRRNFQQLGMQRRQGQPHPRRAQGRRIVALQELQLGNFEEGIVHSGSGTVDERKTCESLVDPATKKPTR